MATDVFLDVCTYHRSDFDLALVRSRSYDYEIQVVAESLQNTFSEPPTTGLGSLNFLPTELLYGILNHLDVFSSFRFRRTNRQARVVSTALPEYKSVALHGLEDLRGLLRGGLAQVHTIRDLYALLICENCTLCGNCGGFYFS